ncbi:hypothetical protein [Alkalinema sp. FACHB-956]|uniref:hypothetical protein n=1 Tax=Alkalinema sp. FACHB-956 TaxID=2692768 RepID=UPI001684AACE|nr:hypothetical protein [Alkalinema sp. FACHB-956]MBD2326201.1 hypothetical protein [Alkalinema sp. FACHB-956]
MDTAHSFDYLYRRAGYRAWNRDYRQQQILRSQQGFAQDSDPESPTVFVPPIECQGCIHYHGVAYGMNRAQRSLWANTTPF